VDSRGRTIWIADAHRGCERFIVRADEKLTPFLELESVIRGLRRIGLTDRRDFFKTRRRQKDLNQAEDFPRWVLRLFQTCKRRINTAGQQKGNIHESPDSAQNNSITTHHTGASQLCVFATNTGSSGRCSGAGRVLSRVHDSGRVQCP
jgi:hypothetical protein